MRCWWARYHLILARVCGANVDTGNRRQKWQHRGRGIRYVGEKPSSRRQVSHVVAKMLPWPWLMRMARPIMTAYLEEMRDTVHAGGVENRPYRLLSSSSRREAALACAYFVRISSATGGNKLLGVSGVSYESRLYCQI